MRFLPPTPPPRHKPVEDMASVIASLDCKTPPLTPSTPGAFAGDPCFFSRGAHTFRVPSTLHEDNRTRAIALLKDHPPGIIVLVGGIARTRNDSDHEELFRQESYFQHLFGVKEPGWVGTVEVPSGTCTLFAPELPKSYAVWHVCGVFVTLELDAVAAMACTRCAVASTPSSRPSESLCVACESCDGAGRVDGVFARPRITQDGQDRDTKRALK